VAALHGVQAPPPPPHHTHTCSSRPSFIQDIMMRAGLEPPTMSEGATGPELMVLTAACRRL
jgi:hypothetical protein